MNPVPSCDVRTEQPRPSSYPSACVYGVYISIQSESNLQLLIPAKMSMYALAPIHEHTGNSCKLD